MPRISVVIPTYNNSTSLERAINSVLSQTYSDFEVIVVNDGSTDQTSELLDSYGKKIHTIYQTNQERAAARNKGVDAATGEYVAFLDDDDWWCLDKLSKQVDFLDNHPNCELLCSYASQVDVNQTILGTIGMDIPLVAQPFDALPWFYLGNSILTLTVIVTRNALERNGAFDTTITYIEDWDLWMRISILSKIACYPEPLAYYQLHQRFMPTVLNRHRTQDGRIYVLEKVDRLVEVAERECLNSSLVCRGKARAWWYGALIDYGSDHFDAAEERASKSFETDPSFFDKRNSESALEMLVGFAASLNEGFTDLVSAAKFLEGVMHHCPIQLLPYFDFNQVQAALFAWYGHWAFQHKDYHKASICMCKALVADPKLIANRGVISVLAHSVIRDG